MAAVVPRVGVYIKEGILEPDDANPFKVQNFDGVDSASRADLFYVADALKSLIAQNSSDMDVGWLVLCGMFGVR